MEKNEKERRKVSGTLTHTHVYVRYTYIQRHVYIHKSRIVCTRCMVAWFSSMIYVLGGCCRAQWENNEGERRGQQRAMVRLLPLRQQPENTTRDMKLQVSLVYTSLGLSLVRPPRPPCMSRSLTINPTTPDKSLARLRGGPRLSKLQTE